MITVDGKPYWADAIGQIPFGIAAYRNTGSIDRVIELGRKYGEGKLIGGKRETDNYDIFFITRAAIYASQRFNVIRNSRGVRSTQNSSFPPPSTLAKPITKNQFQNYLSN